MDTDQQRGRSPSAGAHDAIRQSRPLSTHDTFTHDTSSLSVDQSFLTEQPTFNLNPSFNISDNNLNHDYASSNQHQSGSTFDHDGSPFSIPLLDPTGSSPNNQSFENPYFSDNSVVDTQQHFIDPSSLLDPQLLDPSSPPEGSVDPANLMNPMATTQHSPTPPHMLQPGMHHGSPNHSPSMSHHSIISPAHSRQASLDPSSAAYPQMSNGEWAHAGNPAFQGHRRATSDAFSDVSSSAHPSPYLGNTDPSDLLDQPSPLLSAQQDQALFQDVMSFQQFSISDAQNQHHGTTPGHSPHISPRLPPQQQELPAFTAHDNFGMVQPMGGQYVGAVSYMDSKPQGAPSYHAHHPSLDFGQADQMSPPEINIDFAPPSRQSSFGPNRKGQTDNALSPPDRTRSRNRMRAVSDPFIGHSRPTTPGQGLDPSTSLSPESAKLSSRNSSPGGRQHSRRSSTSSIPHRDYILDLADSARPVSNNGDVPNSNKKPTQKHPATFQCTLCPKRFTRAYNLRSHLRTHTDERPFVCSVCGKAFARQHDRKRHEGLHSGEKKFVCRGFLKAGNGWGCGRRFARADALGRHFRSEAGRVCIRPLLEEEAQEKGWDNHPAASQQGLDASSGMLGGPMGQAVSMAGGQPMGQHFVSHQPGFDPSYGAVTSGMDPSATMGVSGAPATTSYGLPAALLAQYPALAGIQWDSLPAGPPDDLELEGEISGRSSFDASSGGEIFEEDDGAYQTGQQTNAAYGWQGAA